MTTTTTAAAADIKMKKRVSGAPAVRPAKKRRTVQCISEYHATPSVRADDGDIIWPAPQAQIESAKDFILEW